jgi:hypothetical protein
VFLDFFVIFIPDFFLFGFFYAALLIFLFLPKALLLLNDLIEEKFAIDLFNARDLLLSCSVLRALTNLAFLSLLLCPCPLLHKVI